MAISNLRIRRTTLIGAAALAVTAGGLALGMTSAASAKMTSTTPATATAMGGSQGSGCGSQAKHCACGDCDKLLTHRIFSL